MDHLEQTQEIDAPEMTGSGIWRITRLGAGVEIDGARELSQRYPTVEIRMMIQQAE